MITMRLTGSADNINAYLSAIKILKPNLIISCIPAYTHNCCDNDINLISVNVTISGGLN